MARRRLVRGPTPEEAAYTAALVAAIADRIEAEADPVGYGNDLAAREAAAVAQIRAVLAKLPAVSAARVLRELARDVR